MAPPRKHVLSEQEIAALAGVSDTSWRSHRKQGAPVPTSRDKLEPWLRDYHAWRKAHGKVSTTTEMPPATVTPEHRRWSTERAKYLAIASRIAVSEKLGELVPRREVVEFAGRACLVVRQRLNEHVRKMSSRLLGAPSEFAIEQALQAEVDDILAGFERGLDLMTTGSLNDAEGETETATAAARPSDLDELPPAEAAVG